MWGAVEKCRGLSPDCHQLEMLGGEVELRIRWSGGGGEGGGGMLPATLPLCWLGKMVERLLALALLVAERRDSKFTPQ